MQVPNLIEFEALPKSLSTKIDARFLNLSVSSDRNFNGRHIDISIAVYVAIYRCI